MADKTDIPQQGRATIRVAPPKTRLGRKRRKGATTNERVYSALERYAQDRDVVPTVQPGLDPDAPSIDSMGDARHAIGETLGEGGVGKVFLGVDRDLRRTVALKVLRDEHMNEPVFLQAFLEEAIITGGLDHPNIVPIYEVGVSPELGPYYTMKRLDGVPLCDVLAALRAHEPEIVAYYTLGRLVELFSQALRAVAYAHQRGVIHCDIKPGNILVGRYGEVFVVDWGLAKVMGEAGKDQARGELWSGSPGYMAPEQALSEDVGALDERADVWSLGAVLYELMTLVIPHADAAGEPPPEDLHWRDVPPPSSRDTERPVPAELEATCMRALARDPDDRHDNAEAMLREVDSWLDGSRERRQRDEAAARALDLAVDALDKARPFEAKVDRLQMSTSPLSATAQASLDNARSLLVVAYRQARDAIAQGLKANKRSRKLQDAAAALYWQCFQRVFPARLQASTAHRNQGLELLESLSNVALPAIVRHAHDNQPELGAIDVSWMPTEPGKPRDAAVQRMDADDGSHSPWLSAVTLVAGAPDDNPIVHELVSRIRVLQRVELFQHLRAPALLNLADACERRHYAAGDLLFERGDPGDALFIVASGEVEITRAGRVLATLGPDSCFGEIALIDEATRSAGARCATDVDCLAMTAHRFRQLICDDGAIGLRVMRVLARRLRVATEREVSARQEPVNP